MDYRAALISFYRKHNPLKLVEVDALLRKYKGREEELLHALRVKYKVNERDEPVEDEPVKKHDEPIKMTPPPPPRVEQEEPPRMQAVKNEEPPYEEQTRSSFSDADVARTSGDEKGRTAAERAEYWRKELERRERERGKKQAEKRTEPTQKPKAERMKVVREDDDNSEEEVREKKSLNIKVISLIALGVILLIAVVSILLSDNLRTTIGTKLGFGKDEKKVEEKAKKEGLDPDVFGNTGDSAKKTGEFSLEEEPEESAPSVEDALNEQPSSQAQPPAQKITNDTPPASTVQRGKFYIGCAAVANEETAKATASDLRRKGFDNAGYFYIPDYDPAGKNFYRIYVGPFNSIEEAEEAIVNVRSENPGAYPFFLK